MCAWIAPVDSTSTKKRRRSGQRLYFAASGWHHYKRAPKALKLHLENAAGEYRILGYKSGGIVVNDQAYTNPIIVSPAEEPEAWPVSAMADLTRAHLDPLLARQPEVVLIGTGPRQIFPDLQLLAALYEQHIGVEVMDTAAACRTFNIIAGEGRRVVAGLLPLD